MWHSSEATANRARGRRALPRNRPQGVSAVGIRTLAVFDLDALYPMPQMHSRDGLNGVSFERKVTFLGYAAYRRRHEFVKHLRLQVLRAGRAANRKAPSGRRQRMNGCASCSLAPLWRGMASAAAAYAVEYIAQLRSCGTGRGSWRSAASVLCLWRGWLDRLLRPLRLCMLRGLRVGRAAQGQW